MSAGALKKSKVREREARAWELSIAGFSERAIALKLAEEGLGPISHQGVHVILNRVADRHAAELAEKFLDHAQRERARQLAELTHVYREAMRAWAQSKEPKKRVSTAEAEREQVAPGAGRLPAGGVAGLLALSGDGAEPPAPPPPPEKVTLRTKSTNRDVQDTDGDRGYLQTAMEAKAAIRRIYGIEAADRLDLDVALSPQERARAAMKAQGAAPDVIRRLRDALAHGAGADHAANGHAR